MLLVVAEGAFCLAQKVADWDPAMIAVAFDIPGIGSAANAKLVELVGCSSTCAFARCPPGDPDIANALVECPDTIGVFDARYGKQAIPPLSALIGAGTVILTNFKSILLQALLSFLLLVFFVLYAITLLQLNLGMPILG